MKIQLPGRDLICAEPHNSIACCFHVVILRVCFPWCKTLVLKSSASFHFNSCQLTGGTIKVFLPPKQMGGGAWQKMLVHCEMQALAE